MRERNTNTDKPNHQERQQERRVPCAFGASLGPKPDGSMRILYQNINGAPKEADRSLNEPWTTRLASYETDFALFSEININWPKTRQSANLQARLRHDWSNSRTTLGYNRHAPYARTEHLQGGTACISFGSCASRSSEAGSDPRGLGRWSWQKIRGPDESCVTFIAAYAPARSGNDGLSVMSQQRTFFSDRDDDRDPKEIFMIDLQDFLTELRDSGSHIVLGIDANLDTEAQPFTNWMSQVGLTNPLRERYGECPHTYVSGSRPIDALLVSEDFPFIQGGMVSEKDLLDSDHKGLWMDFDPQPIIGRISFEPVSTPRRLSAANPSALRKYVKSYSSFAKEHDLARRVQELLQRVMQDGATDKSTEELNELDELRWQGMVAAEKGCRRLRMARHHNSPQLSQLYRNKKFIAIRIRQRSGQPVSSSSIRRARSRASVHISQHARVADLRKLMQEVERDIRAAKRCSQEDTARHIRAKAEMLASIDDLPASVHEKRLQSQSHSRNIFSQIRQCLRPPRHKAASFSTTLSDGTVIEAFDRKGMEELALKEGEKRFRQTEGHPFLQERLLQDLGLRADGPKVNDVLDGTYRAPEDLPENISRLLKAFQRAPGLSEDVPVITETEWVKLWRRSNERTACGDSGLHFAMFKANCTHPRLLAIDLAFANISYKTGSILTRWRRSINVFIPKSSGTNRVEKHRIIHLWEADANGIFKILSRQAHNLADDRGLLAQEQYGSRREHSAIALSLAKRLTFDIARQRRQTIAFCSNDARQCYDRMIHTPSALALRRIGMAKEPVECMFGMLQGLQHYAQTAHGISDDFFSTTVTRQEADTALPVQGIGQGNGAGPTIWAALSSTVLHSGDMGSTGLQMVAPISGRPEVISNMALVDDTDTFEGARVASDTPDDVIVRLQRATDMWIDGVRATGGDVNAEKTFWSLVDFDFPNGKKPRYAKISDRPGDLFVTENGQKKRLQRLDPSESILTLGVLLAPDGNERDQVARMTAQAREWARKIQRRKLPKEVVDRALRCTIERTLSYPLAVTTLSKQECSAITSPIRRAVLPLLGFNRNLPQIIAEGTRDNGGLGIVDLWAEQLSQRNTMLVRYGSSNTLTGKQIRCTTELLKLEIGNGLNLGSCRASDWAHLASDSWIKQTWLDNEEAGLSFNDPTPNIQLLSVRDAFINQIALELKMSWEERRGVNHCRLYLRVSTIAEICTSDGSQVRREMYTWMRGSAPTSLHPKWPRQRVPNAAETRAWKKLLSQVAQGRSSVQLPLGQWYYDLCTEHHRLDLYDFTQSTLYRRQAEGWEKWRQVQGHRANRLQSTIFKERLGLTDEPPTQRCRPTRSRHKKRHLTIEKTRPCQQRPAKPKSFLDHINALDRYKSWACQDIEGSLHTPDIAEAIQQRRAIGVSDGSFKDGRSSAAWIIRAAPDDTENLEVGAVRGFCLVPGTTAEQDSCRAELGGIAGIVYAAEAICKAHRIDSGGLVIGLDGLSALELCRLENRHAQSIKSHHDLFNDIISAMKRLPIDLSFRHVRGHQDDAGLEGLDSWELLNVKMDEAAKAYRNLPGTDICKAIPFGSPHFHLRSSRGSIARNLRRRCRKAAQEANVRTYWSNKFGWSPERREAIAWSARDEACSREHPSTRRFVIQHATGFSSAGSRMKKRGVTDVMCPFCGGDETELHVFSCEHADAKARRDELLAGLEKKLRRLNTPRELRESIVACATPANDEKGRTQQRINDTGPLETLLGFLPMEWVDRYETSRQEEMKTGMSWASAVIQLLWRLAKELWGFRNDRHHETAKPREEERRREQRRSEIEQLWDTGRSKMRLLTLQERALFEGSAQRILDKEEGGQRGWIACASAALRRMVRRTDREYASERLGLRIFLGLA